MRDKVLPLGTLAGLATEGDGAAGEAAPRDGRPLAREGLLELGYSSAEVERLLERAQGSTAEELIAEALRMARTP